MVVGMDDRFNPVGEGGRRGRLADDLRRIRGFMLDMDGTVYLGSRRLPGASEFVHACRRTGRRVIFVTNNSSKDRMIYAQKLVQMGIDASPDEILTSGEATISYMKAMGYGPNVYVLGTKPLLSEFVDAGFVLDDEHPSAVVVGFDMDLTYERLRRACEFIREGASYIATHPDLNCPTESGPIPDAGCLIAAIKASTGREPKVIGKPNAEMVLAALTKLGLERHEVAVVGDRLYTDVAMGMAAGITSVLVLSGETSADDLKGSPFVPDLVVQGIGDLLPMIG